MADGDMTEGVAAVGVGGLEPVMARPPRRFRNTLRRIARKRLGLVGVAMVLVLALAAIFAPIVAPYGYAERRIQDRFQGPSAEHLMGTDSLGRDVFSRVVYGGRVSLGIGIVAAAAGTALALVLGLVSGFAGGAVDMLLQRVVDAWMALPFLVIALAAVAVVGPSIPIIIIILSASFGITGARVVRSAVLSVMHEPYVEAGRIVGCSDLRLMTRHVLPNIFPPVIVLGSLSVGNAIVAEASLSFLGFGIPPPHPSWGAMVGGTALDYLYNAPWLAFFPGLALSLAVYGLNVAGDAVRDLLDPRLRGVG